MVNPFLKEYNLRKEEYVKMAKVDLSKYGITGTTDIVYNPSYETLFEVMEDYNVKILSTKVYWDRPEERQAYKKFWEIYEKAKDDANNK